VYPFIAVGHWQFSTYGICLITGLFVGYAIFRVELRRRLLQGINSSEVMCVMALGAVVGGRLYGILESLGRARFPELLTTSGFVYYGALLLDCIVALLLARRYRIGVLALSDSLAVPCALAYGIARIGCFLSGDGDYGIATSLPWGMSFPHGLVPTTERVHPAPLYEFLTSATIAFALWRRGSPVREPRAPIGELSALFLIWTGVARFLVEFIKRNPRPLWGLAEAQLIGLISILAGFALLCMVQGLTAPNGNHARAATRRTP
jgi:phosphatidylglycerol---prolipoprotein diacylglyceryl transferase